jgi:hypothetical protein
MVEIIEVRHWTGLTSYAPYSVFTIRLQSEEDLLRLAKTHNIDFIFKRGQELICLHGRICYWYKP